MELDELKRAWHELDRRMEAIDLKLERVQKEVKLSRTRVLLRRFGGVLLFELVCNTVAVVLLGSFLTDHIDELRFAIPTLILHLAALALIVVGIRQLALIARIDYSLPVVAIQRQLALVRTLRVRSIQWTFLLAPLLWTPLAIVCAQGFLGLDLYAGLGMQFIAINIGVGLFVIPLGIQAARACAGRLGNSPILRRMADSVAGYSLTRALTLVQEIEMFERES